MRRSIAARLDEIAAARRNSPVVFSKETIEKILVDLDSMEPELEKAVSRYVALQKCRTFFKNELVRLQSGVECLNLKGKADG